MATLTGTTFKVAVSVTEGLGSLTMDDIGFSCSFFCYPNRRVDVDKSEMIRESESQYIAIVDSEKVGAGTLRLILTADVPDHDCPGGFRKEVIDVPTGIEIRKGL